MYFLNLEDKEHCCVENPFRVTEKPPGFLSVDYEKLIENTSDTRLKAKFEEVSLDIFWGIYLNNILKYQNKPQKSFCHLRQHICMNKYFQEMLI